MRETLVGMSLRLLVMLIGIVLVFGGGVVFLHVLGALPPVVVDQSGFALHLDLSALRVPVALLWGAGGLISALVGGLLLILSFVRASVPQRTVSLTGTSSNGMYGGGQVTVTMDSLRALTAYVGERVEGIRELEPSLALRKDGWHVRCQASVVPQVALPQAVNSLKQALTEALEHHTGVPVAKIDVHTQLSAIDASKRVR